MAMIILWQQLIAGVFFSLMVGPWFGVGVSYLPASRDNPIPSWMLTVGCFSLVVIASFTQSVTSANFKAHNRVP